MEIDFPWIQVAGVHDLQEARLIAKANIPFLGLPLRLPVHQEDLSEQAAKKLISEIQPDLKVVVITYLSQASDISAFIQELGAGIVQLHGQITQQELETLRGMMPELVIIKSLVIGKNSQAELITELDDLSDVVDLFITDTFDPDTGACGATGKVHDWRLSAELVERSEKPVILAGGLCAENVCEAVVKVKPAGVDVHTGVEGSDGRKDLKKMQVFMAELTKAYKKLGYITFI
jgi:phosphoribosylanthranilate isomerase